MTRFHSIALQCNCIHCNALYDAIKEKKWFATIIAHAQRFLYRTVSFLTQFLSRFSITLLGVVTYRQKSNITGIHFYAIQQ